MDVEIAKANIEQFNNLLETGTGKQTRAVVLCLLVNGKSKFAVALERQNKKETG